MQLVEWPIAMDQYHERCPVYYEYCWWTQQAKDVAAYLDMPERVDEILSEEGARRGVVLAQTSAVHGMGEKRVVMSKVGAPWWWW